jgi:NAD(P)-dependent dehydrogenase (short-subunit alcohol dehydrogenase family)
MDQNWNDSVSMEGRNGKFRLLTSRRPIDIHQMMKTVNVAARAPMNRWGLPEEVAYTASFLASDKASFITGTSVNVDGGYVAC